MGDESLENRSQGQGQTEDSNEVNPEAEFAKVHLACFFCVKNPVNKEAPIAGMAAQEVVASKMAMSIWISGNILPANGSAKNDIRAVHSPVKAARLRSFLEGA